MDDNAQQKRKKSTDGSDALNFPTFQDWKSFRRDVFLQLSASGYILREINSTFCLPCRNIELDS